MQSMSSSDLVWRGGRGENSVRRRRVEGIDDLCRRESQANPGKLRQGSRCAAVRASAGLAQRDRARARGVPSHVPKAGRGWQRRQSQLKLCFATSSAEVRKDGWMGLDVRGVWVGSRARWRLSCLRSRDRARLPPLNASCS